MATRSMEVDVRGRGVGGLARELRDAAAAARELQREADALRNLQVGGGTGTAAGVRSRGASVASAAREQVQQDRFLSGPRQDLMRIQAERERAMALAEGPQRTAILGDLADREARSRRRVILNERLKASGEEGLQAPGLLQSFQQLNALMASLKAGNVLGIAQNLAMGVKLLQAGAGGGLNITRKLAGAGGSAGAGAGAGTAAGAASELEGLGAAAAEVAAPLTAAGAILALDIAALKSFAENLAAATRTAREFAEARTLSGGTGREVAGLRVLGLGPGQIAGQAAALRERLGSDPFAMLAGLRTGAGYRLPRPFGDTNEAGDLMRTLEGLRQVKDAEEQLRLARMLGLETDLELIRVSDRVWESLKRDADVQGRIYDDQTLQNARDLAAETQRVSQGWDTLRESLMKTAMPQVTSDLDNFAGGLNALADWFNAHQDLTSGAWQGIRDSLVNQVPFLRPLLDLGGSANAATATQENTRALEANTQAQLQTAYLLRVGATTGAQRERIGRLFPEAAWNNPLAFRDTLRGQTLGAGGYRL